MLKTAMGRVRVCRPARMTEKRKLFQEKTKARIAVAITPGLARGRAIRQNAARYEQPSMRAASSRSAGTSSKKPIITQMMMGSPTIRWVRMRAPKVSTIRGGRGKKKEREERRGEGGVW